MSNIQDLRNELKNYNEIVDTTDALDLIDDIQNELYYKDDTIKELENKIERLEDKEEEQESIDLGLDTINFNFDKGNLVIRQQFDKMMQHLCKTPNAII